MFFSYQAVSNKFTISYMKIKSVSKRNVKKKVKFNPLLRYLSLLERKATVNKFRLKVIN